MTENILNSFIVIIIICIFFSYLYSKFYLELGLVKILFLASISSFVSLFLIMLLNAAGVNYYYFDEFLVSGLYIFLFPSKWQWIKDTKGLKK